MKNINNEAYNKNKELINYWEHSVYYFLKRNLHIELFESDTEIGYTMNGNDVYLNLNSNISKSQKDEYSYIRFNHGVYLHESLHQLLTNFSAYKKGIEKISKSYPTKFIETFKTVFNILEDNYIENYSNQYLVKDDFRDLIFSKFQIFQNSPKINTLTCDWDQFIAALINFGDAGVINGYFTFDRAKYSFDKILPHFVKGANETDINGRINICINIVNTTKHMWEKCEKVDKMSLNKNLSHDKSFSSKKNKIQIPIKTKNDNVIQDHEKNYKNINIYKIEEGDNISRKKFTETNEQDKKIINKIEY